MVQVISYEDHFFHPPSWPGLEEVIRFPDGEIKNDSLPNSTVWVFNANDHVFRPEILGNDAGCGMTGFFLKDVDHIAAADAFYNLLKQRRVIGGGNHFIDICAPIESCADLRHEPYKILLIHTHGPDKSVPQAMGQAQQKQRSAESFRQELGQELAELVDSPCKLMGDWTHNTVAVEDNKVIYRKGVVKVEAGKLYPLPAHLGAKILWYTPNPTTLPPYCSMPHATGRRGPLGDTKVDTEEVEILREMVYIPAGISSPSLRSEHPSCYNGYDKIMGRLLHEKNLFIPVGETRILSYIGKV